MPSASPRVVLLFWLLSPGASLLAQSSGAISGTVTNVEGAALAGVSVEAHADVLPGARVAVSAGNGMYRLPALPPGDYTLRFDRAGLSPALRRVHVQLGEDTVANVRLGVPGIADEVTVTAGLSLGNTASAPLASGLSREDLARLPVGQDYRDVQKLIPGVPYSQDSVRGPSAGGSGQDNVYRLDGTSVTLPLFGTLSAEPASYDLAQVTIVRGGAPAIDFDRAGGFAMDSVSQSGTSTLRGRLSYQLQTSGMVADLTSGARSRYQEDRRWADASLGGPLLKDRLYFFASYYRPEQRRANQANLYGALPRFESTRNEVFGKLTVKPSRSVLLNLSYRSSKRVETGDLFAANAAATTGSGSAARLGLGTLEGSWILTARSHATFKYAHFADRTEGRPDHVADSGIGTRLDIDHLDREGRLSVPLPINGDAGYNAFIQPLVDRYGYLQAGVRTGGGFAGLGLQFDDDDFFRDSGQIGYNLTIGRTVTHDLHVGYQRYTDAEDLTRRSNGWGLITVPGGRQTWSGTPVFYQVTLQQQTAGAVPAIHSEYRSQSFEIQDAVHWRAWEVDAGLLASQDTLYGQGLREDASVLSGFVGAPGNRYKMYEIPFKKMIQPRLGVTFAYDEKGSIHASYAKYNPPASSLPRAAAWDRNLATTINAYFDAAGVLIGTDPVAASSGKLFVPDLTPRATHELVIGTSRQLNTHWSARLAARYRRSSHFWEDTNNDARIAFDPPAGIPRELYIPDLSTRLAQIGSGSSFVIAALDGAYTLYYETTVETEWRDPRTFVNASYTWSRYRGNFDQDNTALDNDLNLFIGSSNIGDDAGRQLWNLKDGILRGDRPHLFKVYGHRTFSWRGSVGVFGVAQSGQPWEAWSVLPYRSLTSSTSDTNRYAEPAGSRRSKPHWQLDLNYTQDLPRQGRLRVQLAADVFNVFNKQTGYSIEPRQSNSLFGTPRLYFDPRRLQVAARLQF